MSDQMIRSGMVQFHPALEPFLVDIDRVECHPENYNNGDVEAIIASIETDGFYNVIKVQASTGWPQSGQCRPASVEYTRPPRAEKEEAFLATFVPRC